MLPILLDQTRKTKKKKKTMSKIEVPKNENSHLSSTETTRFPSRRPGAMKKMK
jgi:hypothetical protein